MEEAVSRTKVLGNRKIEARNRQRRVADPRDRRGSATRREHATTKASSDSSLFHRGRLAKQFLIGRRVKADHERTTFPESRGSQVPGRSQQEREELSPAWLVLLQVNIDNLLPFRCVNLVHLSDQRERFLFLEDLFLRIHLQRDLDAIFRKKLLRLGAALSPGTMVPPIDSFH